MVKVAFDAQLFLKGNKTGIGWCADNLVRTIAKDKSYECELNYFSKGYSGEILKNVEEYQQWGLKLRECWWFNDVWYKLLWPFVGLPYHWFFSKGNQITQFFNYVIPPGVKGKKVTIVHDMAHLACPETVRVKTKRWLDLTLRQSCRRADVILTVSEFSKSEIVRYMKIPKEKIVVMLPGVDLELFRANYSSEMVETAKKKYNIEGDYFLYLGTIEPRKNIQRVIDAYVQLRGKVEHLPRLVLAGGKGWLCDSIYESVENLNKNDDMMFTGYIDELDSPLLISGAKALLFPSLYEGFGTPPVEAMACGTPVISSKAASMPEVIGDAGLLVDPYSVDEIGMAMERILSDVELCDQLIQKGLKRAQKYTWDNAAEILKGVYNDLLISGSDTT